MQHRVPKVLSERQIPTTRHRGVALTLGLLLAACSSSPGQQTATDSGILHLGQDSGSTKHDGARLPDSQTLFDVSVLENPFGCSSDANCSGGQHCDTRQGSVTQGQCVTCLTSGQCMNSQVCAPAAGECVFDCRLAGSLKCATTSLPLCDPGTGACVECQTSADCASSPIGPICDTVNHACVECNTIADCKNDATGCSNGLCGRCLAASDCAPNQKCIADTVAGGGGFAPGECVCANNAGCTGNPNGAVCDNGSCTCVSSSDCSHGAHCDTATHECQAPCMSSEDCIDNPVNVACDTATGVCVGCVTSSDCSESSTGMLCLTSTNTCVQCLTNDDCDTEDGEICTPSNTCGTCTTNAQCAGSPNGSACTPSGCGCNSDNDCTDDPAALDAGGPVCMPNGGDAGGYCGPSP